MNSGKLVFLAAVTLLQAGFLAGAARAQDGSAQPANPTGNASAPATAANTAAGSGTAAAATPTTPAKKVWTNEDMGAIHSNSAISTFSGDANKPAGGRPGAAKTGSKAAGQYPAQIATLQAKLPPLDAQIAELQAGLSGATVNATRHYGGEKLDDLRDQLARLQKRRDDIAARISALQDEARHHGVPDNQIP